MNASCVIYSVYAAVSLLVLLLLYSLLLVEVMVLMVVLLVPLLVLDSCWFHCCRRIDFSSLKLLVRLVVLVSAVINIYA